MKKRKNRENFLDYTPKPNALYEWIEKRDGHIEISVKNRGLCNRTAQLFFHKPKVSKIELDDFGSFVWKQMNGEKSIYEIGKEVRNRFGKTAEPLYTRLAKFVKILHENNFIVYTNKLKKV